VHNPIEGDGVLLRPTAPQDLDSARRLFTDPGFYEHWDGYANSDEEIKEKFLGARSPTVECFFVEVDGAVVGFTQYHFADDGLEGGMDLVLLPGARGRGIGGRVVRAMASFVRTQLRWSRFTVDPEVTNERGVHFWKKVGFVAVRVVDDGTHPPHWHMEWPTLG
jgi:aminoglycoside 6'-N-acetyltransferase